MRLVPGRSWTRLLLVLLPGPAGCQTVQTTRGGEVGVDRRQTMTVLTPSSAQVEAAAQQ